MVNNMVKAEIGKVTVQPRKAGGYMITIPIAVVRGLGIKDNETMAVYVDFNTKEITYKLI